MPWVSQSVNVRESSHQPASAATNEIPDYYLGDAFHAMDIASGESPTNGNIVTEEEQQRIQVDPTT